MQLVEREAIRAILLTPENEILLMCIRNPVTKLLFWVCPGGGLSPGEGLEAGLQRELAEELGLRNFTMSAPVHRRHHTFNWKDKRISQRETFVVVETKKFTPVMSDAVEAESLEEFRWWPLAEINVAAHPITPVTLKEIVESFRAHGAPTGPLDCLSESD
jgi:8-oxo-dGTP pyrophosphatase MutT (NUDIX family)